MPSRCGSSASSASASSSGPAGLLEQAWRAPRAPRRVARARAPAFDDGQGALGVAASQCARQRLGTEDREPIQRSRLGLARPGREERSVVDRRRPRCVADPRSRARSPGRSRVPRGSGRRPSRDRRARDPPLRCDTGARRDARAPRRRGSARRRRPARAGDRDAVGRFPAHRRRARARGPRRWRGDRPPPAPAASCRRSPWMSPISSQSSARSAGSSVPRSACRESRRDALRVLAARGERGGERFDGVRVVRSFLHLAGAAHRGPSRRRRGRDPTTRGSRRRAPWRVRGSRCGSIRHRCDRRPRRARGRRRRPRDASVARSSHSRASRGAPSTSRCRRPISSAMAARARAIAHSSRCARDRRAAASACRPSSRSRAKRASIQRGSDGSRLARVAKQGERAVGIPERAGGETRQRLDGAVALRARRNGEHPFPDRGRVARATRTFERASHARQHARLVGRGAQRTLEGVDRDARVGAAERLLGVLVPAREDLAQLAGDEVEAGVERRRVAQHRDDARRIPAELLDRLGHAEEQARALGLRALLAGRRQVRFVELDQRAPVAGDESGLLETFERRAIAGIGVEAFPQTVRARRHGPLSRPLAGAQPMRNFSALASTRPGPGLKGFPRRCRRLAARARSDRLGATSGPSRPHPWLPIPAHASLFRATPLRRACPPSSLSVGKTPRSGWRVPAAERRRRRRELWISSLVLVAIAAIVLGQQWAAAPAARAAGRRLRPVPVPQRGQRHPDRAARLPGRAQLREAGLRAAPRHRSART